MSTMISVSRKGSDELRSISKNKPNIFLYTRNNFYTMISYSYKEYNNSISFFSRDNYIKMTNTTNYSRLFRTYSGNILSALLKGIMVSVKSFGYRYQYK